MYTPFVEQVNRRRGGGWNCSGSRRLGELSAACADRMGDMMTHQNLTAPLAEHWSDMFTLMDQYRSLTKLPDVAYPAAK
jgi:hypothetical protein